MRVALTTERQIDPAKRTRRGRPAFRMSSAGKGDVVLKCQSRLEWLFAMLFVLHPGISEIYFQPLIVNLTRSKVYRKKIKLDPRYKYYIPDFLIVVNGKEFIVEVKSAALLGMTNKDFDQIQEIFEKNAIGFCKLTELDLGEAENNIRILYEYCVHDADSVTTWSNDLKSLLETHQGINHVKELAGLLEPVNWYVCAGILRGVISFDLLNWDLMGMNFPIVQTYGSLKHLEVISFV